MEINRKTYSWIIKLLRAKELSADNALEVADDICTLLEKEVISIAPISTPMITTNEILNQPLGTITTASTWRRTFKPFEKVNWWQVDWKWKFHPIQAWAGKGWVRSEDWKIVDL